MRPILFLPRVTVVDCGATRTAVGVFRRHAGRLRLEGGAVERFAAPGGEGAWFERTATSLRALRAKVEPAGRVVLVLPAHLTLAKHIRTPRVGARQRTKVVRFEVAQALPCPLEEVIWDTVPVAESPAGSDLLVVAGKLGTLAALHATARDAGFVPDVMLPAAAATLNIARLVEFQERKPGLILNLGARSTVIVQMERARFALRSVGFGGNSVSQRLPPAEGGEVLAVRIAQEVGSTLLYFKRQGWSVAPSRILIAGGPSRHAGLAAALAARLKLPVERLVLSSVVGLPEEVTAAHALFDEGEGVEMAGVAAGELLSLPAGPNLLPVQVACRKRRGQSWLLAAAGVVAMGLWLPAGPQPGKAKVAKSPILPAAIAPAPVQESRSVAIASPEDAARLELQEIKLEPFPLSLAGYFGDPGHYRVALRSSPAGEIVFAVEGESIARWEVTLARFRVRKLAVETEWAGPMFDIVAEAVLRDERSGQELTLTSRQPQQPVPHAVLRTAGAQWQLREGEMVEANGARYRIERIALAPPQVVVIRKDASRAETVVLQPAGALEGENAVLMPMAANAVRPPMRHLATADAQ
jgi:type IV pilus assembly protein PilM